MEAGTLGSGPSYWQVGAALVAVLGLLIVVLKFLQRWQRTDGAGGDVRLVSVRRLGPRRELQILQVGDEVHTLYRQESAMVVLKTESRIQHEAAALTAAPPPPPLQQRLRALVAAAGGRATSIRP